MEADDIKYAWAAYKLGALAEFDAVFQAEYDANTFREVFREVVLHYDAAWTLFAESPKGRIPVGVVTAFNPIGHVFYIGKMSWFPWASRRNVLESALNFLNTIRQEVTMFEYARQKDKRFFEQMCRYGIMRRVGTSHGIYDDEPAAVFETRRVPWGSVA